MIDFLKLAEECEAMRIVLNVDGQNYKTAPYDTDVETILASSSAALRQAHSLQEAYTNLGSERDNLLLECETLRGEIARLRAILNSVRALANEDREDLGVEMFQEELREILGEQP